MTNSYDMKFPDFILNEYLDVCKIVDINLFKGESMLVQGHYFTNSNSLVLLLHELINYDYPIVLTTNNVNLVNIYYVLRKLQGNKWAVKSYTGIQDLKDKDVTLIPYNLDRNYRNQQLPTFINVIDIDSCHDNYTNLMNSNAFNILISTSILEDSSEFSKVFTYKNPDDDFLGYRQKTLETTFSSGNMLLLEKCRNELLDVKNKGRNLLMNPVKVDIDNLDYLTPETVQLLCKNKI